MNSKSQQTQLLRLISVAGTMTKKKSMWSSKHGLSISEMSMRPLIEQGLVELVDNNTIRTK